MALEYAEGYAEHYTDRSLVTKEYVDNIIDNMAISTKESLVMKIILLKNEHEEREAYDRELMLYLNS
jgi:hypothetical protein